MLEAARRSSSPAQTRKRRPEGRDDLPILPQQARAGTGTGLRQACFQQAASPDKTSAGSGVASRPAQQDQMRPNFPARHCSPVTVASSHSGPASAEDMGGTNWEVMLVLGVSSGSPDLAAPLAA